MSKVHLVEAALRRWDPMGVFPGEMAPADEYDSYAPHIVSLVEGGCAAADLATHLASLRASIVGASDQAEMDMTIAAEICNSLRRRSHE